MSDALPGKPRSTLDALFDSLDNWKDPDTLRQAILKAADADDDTLEAALKECSILEQKVIQETVRTMHSVLFPPPADGEDTSRDAVQKAVALEKHGIQLMKQGAQSYARRKHTPGAAGGMFEYVTNLLKPPMVPWEAVFSGVTSRALRYNYEDSLLQIDNQQAAIGTYMRRAGKIVSINRIPLFPGEEPRPVFRIAYVIDTSGSMGLAQLQSAYSELQRLMMFYPGIEVVLVYADAVVRDWKILKSIEDIDFTASGRSGTDFDPALEFIRDRHDRGERVDMLLYATDGWCDPPTITLPVPAVWLITEGCRPTPVTTAPGNQTVYMRPYASSEAA